MWSRRFALYLGKPLQGRYIKISTLLLDATVARLELYREFESPRQDIYVRKLPSIENQLPMMEV